MFTDAKVVKLRILFHTAVKSRTNPFIKKNQKNKNKTKKYLGYPLLLPIIKDIVRLSVAQMTSTSKAYIPCLLAIIIK